MFLGVPIFCLVASHSRDFVSFVDIVQVDRLREIVDPVGMVLGASLGDLLGGDSGSVLSAGGNAGGLDTSMASTMSAPPALSQPPRYFAVLRVYIVFLFRLCCLFSTFFNNAVREMRM